MRGGKVVAAATPRFGGVAQMLAQMSLGNGIGVQVDSAIRWMICSARPTAP